MSTDNLTPYDLDQLSRLIVDALQVVDRDQGRNRGLVRLRPGPRDLGGQLADEDEEEGADGESEEEERLEENSPTPKPRVNPPVTPSGHRGNLVTIPCCPGYQAAAGGAGVCSPTAPCKNIQPSADGKTESSLGPNS